MKKLPRFICNCGWSGEEDQLVDSHDSVSRVCPKCGLIPCGWLDWNTLSLDQKVDYLRDKYKFSSTGDANCINSLIRFYDQHKKNPVN